MPQAVNVPDGSWIVVATESISFTIMWVEKKSYQIKTKPPVFTWANSETCQALASW